MRIMRNIENDLRRSWKHLESPLKRNMPQTGTQCRFRDRQAGLHGIHGRQRTTRVIKLKFPAQRRQGQVGYSGITGHEIPLIIVLLEMEMPANLAKLGANIKCMRYHGIGRR